MVGAGRFERPTPCAQGRCATRLRYAPTFAALLILKHFRIKHPTFITRSSPKLSHNCTKTPLYWTSTEPKPFRSSLACRLIFSKASRFICNFICEYFLKTFASPCRSIWVTHSSATPPALSRVA